MIEIQGTHNTAICYCDMLDGAGRLMRRKAALRKLSIDEYRREMAGIYTPCVSGDTLDESPMAYKDIDEIARNIRPTAEIAEHIRTVYNFKATE